MEILSFLVYGHLTELLETADAVYALFHENVKHCGIKETFTKVQEKCAVEPGCSLRELVINGESHWLILVAAGNNLFEVGLQVW